MSVRIYPEWFIDGPWHGEDKRKKCPHLQGMVRCVVPRPFNVRALLDADTSPIDTPEYDEYRYVPKWVDVFGERICVWVGEMNAAGSFLPTGAHPDWVRMLGQLVMEPHRTDGENTPFNVGGIVQRHRERWDIEHEVRRDVRGELSRLRQRITDLEIQLRRANTANVLNERPRLNTRLQSKPHSAAVLEFKDDEGTHEFIMFENIVLYLDEGDGTPENPASWVATAQGPIQMGSDHSPPCTGYGTTKKAAIVALLADGVGVYARMIDIGERMK